MSDEEFIKELSTADFFKDYEENNTSDSKENASTGDINDFFSSDELLNEENHGETSAPRDIPINKQNNSKKDFEDVYSDSSLEEKPEEKIEEKTKNPFKRFGKWFKKLSKPRKIIFSVFCVILAIIIGIGAYVAIYVNGILNHLTNTEQNQQMINDMIYPEEQIDDLRIELGSEGFKQSLIDWATTGNNLKMHSKNVVNILLIGADSRQGENKGNTDVMMLVSVNKRTKKINIVSFLRDSYLYVEGKSASFCTKLNAAFSMGGPEYLMKTIENNYKITIDDYVMVNFESFKAIVDAMGGIDVDVQQYEANYIERHYNISMPVGKGVHLNGEQSLIFCRVRKCDSDGDVSRTRRQRQVIDSMINRAKSATVSEITKYIEVLLPYVATGLEKNEIVNLAVSAVTNGWAKFERNNVSAPSEDCRYPGDADMWIWVIDYQKAAHDLQLAIYGETNIVLESDRTTIIDIYRGASYSGSGSSDSGYQAPVTQEPTVPETTEPSTENSDAPEINDPEIEGTTEESTEDSSLFPGIGEEESTNVIPVPPGEIPPSETSGGEEIPSADATQVPA